MEKKVLDSSVIEKRLCTAAQTGDITMARRYLQKVFRMLKREGQPIQNFETASLHHAARTGNAAVCEVLIEFGCNLEARYRGETPLLAAISHSQEEIVDLLIKNKASPNCRASKSLVTALQAAIAMGLHNTMRTLISVGASVNARDGKQGDCLSYAVRLRGDTAAAKILLDHGADVSAICFNVTALYSAVQKGLVPMVTLLLNYKAKIDGIADPNIWTPLQVAARYNQPAVAQILLQRGADINSAKGKGQSYATAMHLAIGYGHSKVAEVLLKWKPNLELRDTSDRTPLFLSLHHPNLDAARILLEAGADVKAKTDNLVTVLSVAFANKNLELAQLLIKHGADVQEPCNRTRLTYLHEAAVSIDETQVLFLLENKAKVDAVDVNGATPLMAAVEYSRMGNIRLLLGYGANPNATDKIGKRTALQRAAQLGLVETVSILLEHGADPNMYNQAGMSAYMISEHFQQVEIADLLRQITTPPLYNGLLYSAPPDVAPQNSDSKGNAVDGDRRSVATPLLYNRPACPPVPPKVAPEKSDSKGKAVNREHPFIASHVPANIVANKSSPSVSKLPSNEPSDSPNARDESGCTALYNAVKTNDEAAVRTLCKQGADVECPSLNGGLPLILAAFKGYGNIVDVLLQNGANPEDLSDSGLTALHASISPNITEALLKAGGFINVKGGHGETPLHSAIKNGREAIVRMLADKGADLNLPVDLEINRSTPLVLAITWRQSSIAKLLIDRGCDVNLKSGKTLATPLMQAARRMESPELIHLLVDKGARLEERNAANETALEIAAKLSMKAAIEALVQRGANINAIDKDGLTPLMKMVKQSTENGVRMLLEAGADTSMRIPTSGNTALHIAVTNSNRPAIMQLLLRHGANKEQKDAAGFTPLILAASNNCGALVKFLVERGANIEAKDNNGHTALMNSTSNSKGSQIAMLLKNGADIHASHVQTGMQPIHLAAQHRNTTVIMMLLLDRGANVNSLDRQQRTPLVIASMAGETPTVKLLLQKGANVIPLDLLPKVVGRKYEDTAIALIDGGAEMRVQATNGMTVPYLAVYFGLGKLVLHMLEKGISPNTNIDCGSGCQCGGSAGTSLLHVAMWVGADEAVVRALLERGADPNAKTEKSETTPILFLGRAKPEKPNKTFEDTAALFNLMVEYGTDIQYRDKSGDTLLSSTIVNLPSIADKLFTLYLEKGADLDERNSAGETLLHLSATVGAIKCSQVLLSKGFNLAIMDNNGNTALALAIKNLRGNTVQLLLNTKAQGMLSANHAGEYPLEMAVNKLESLQAGDTRKMSEEAKSKHNAALVRAGRIVRLLSTYEEDTMAAEMAIAQTVSKEMAATEELSNDTTVTETLTSGGDERNASAGALVQHVE